MKAAEQKAAAAAARSAEQDLQRAAEQEVVRLQIAQAQKENANRAELQAEAEYQRRLELLHAKLDVQLCKHTLKNCNHVLPRGWN